MLKLKKIFSCILAITTFMGGSNLMANAAETKNNDSSKTVYAHELDSQAYNGNDLGATYSKKSTTFKVWAPTASRVAVRLYTTGSPEEDGAQEISTKPMKKGSKGVWSLTVKGDQKNVYYTYLVTIDGVTKETADIYAKAAGVNGNRSMVVDLAETNPKDWDKDSHIFCEEPTDAVVWEVHVKDFSSGEVSGVSAKYRGKYLAFTESGTTLGGKGDIPTCISYLKSLGVTHVQLLPVYDYATVDEADTKSEQFNWGYDPKNYNVPEGSYSTDPFNGAVRINEFKRMIQALHNEGIGVIMDVVYNHTYKAEGSWFENTVPGYYYRLKSDGSYSDGSGCGNETASEHLMYRKYMIDSILYWTNEYHIDGFRFDLMGVHDVKTMNEIRKALDTRVNNGKKIIMYGEPWTGGELSTKETTAIKDNVKQLDNRIGAFNDTFRDAVKGHVFNALEKGFVQDGSSKGNLVGGITANTIQNQSFNQPSQAVTYLSAHDNYTLYDKLVLSVKNDMSYDKRDENLVGMNKLAAAIMLTSQGISFMQAGEEFARTKFGDGNSYVSSENINQLNWNNLVTYADLDSYYAGLIEIRKNFKPFRDPTTKSAEQIKFSTTGNGVIAYTLENTLTSGKEWSYVAVAFNSTDKDSKVTLQANDGKKLPSEWVIVADKTAAGLEKLGTVSGSEITVPAHSALILADKQSFESLGLTSYRCSVRVEYRDKDSDELLNAHTITGMEGMKYTTNGDESLSVDYDLENISGNENGKYTQKAQKVTYYYKKFTGNIYNLTVNFLKEGSDLLGSGDSEVASSITERIREGSSYTASIRDIDDMEVDLSMFPTNAVGKILDSDVTVNYYYKAKEKSDLTIHYQNSNGYSKVGAYVYEKSEDGKNKEYTGKAPGKEMTPDKELGDGWYVLTVKDIGSLSDINVKFTDMGKQTDSGSNTDGYPVSGECWVKDGAVSYTGEVNTIYVQSNGKVLKTESVTGKVGSEYKTAEENFEGLTMLAKTSNTSGKYTSTPIYVIYSYGEPAITEKSVMPVIIILCSSALVMFIAAAVTALAYQKRKKRMVNV